MCIQLLPFDRKSPRLYDALRVYTNVWSRNTEDSLIFFRRHAELDHFHGFVACLDGRVVGMAFGTESCSGMWWHDKVAQHVGRDHNALYDAWVLTELAVLEPYRNASVGSKLLNAVLMAQPFPNALLSTQSYNTSAQRFYKRHHWTELHAGFPFQRGCDNYVIMHRDMTMGYEH